jgi:ATP-dependent exoDNAse (exonuclease V) alpha subunit
MGDPNQLPPPNGEGSFFERFPQNYVMTEVLRQAEDSPILALAYQALSGEALKPGKYGDSVIYGDKVKASTVTDAMLAADQVLCGKNVTRRGVNREIREKLGLYGEQGKELPVVGDRLICLRNNHQKGILNGEQFLVREIHNKELGEVVYMTVESVYSPGKLVDVAVPWDFFLGTEDAMDFYTKKSYDQFTYGYCVTVHKSQGSQWDNVVILDESKAFREAKKNHLYTAITRAAKNVKVFL